MSSMSSSTSTLRNPSPPPFVPESHEIPDHDEQHFGFWHYFPLLFAILPPIGSLIVGGHSAVWTDVLVLGVMGFWLYQVVRGDYFSPSLSPPSLYPLIST
jgi:hypothetical protein